MSGVSHRPLHGSGENREDLQQGHSRAEYQAPWEASHRQSLQIKGRCITHVWWSVPMWGAYTTSAGQRAFALQSFVTLVIWLMVTVGGARFGWPQRQVPDYIAMRGPQRLPATCPHSCTEKVGLCWSRDAIDLWLVFQAGFVDAAWPRRSYNERITRRVTSPPLTFSCLHQLPKPC